MGAWLAGRQEQVTQCLLSLLFMTQGTGPAKHFVLSRDCSRLMKWLSGTRPAEELCVMQAWYNSWTSHNPLNAVHFQIANFSLLGIAWLMAARGLL